MSGSESANKRKYSRVARSNYNRNGNPEIQYRLLEGSVSGNISRGRLKMIERAEKRCKGSSINDVTQRGHSNNT